MNQIHHWGEWSPIEDLEKELHLPRGDRAALGGGLHHHSRKHALPPLGSLELSSSLWCLDTSICLTLLGKLEKPVTVDFKKHPTQKVGTRSRFPTGLPFPVPEILEFILFCDPGKISSNLPIAFPEFSLGSPRTHPTNSHSLLEFSDLSPAISRCPSALCLLKCKFSFQ